MSQIPKPALILGLGGVIPLVATALAPLAGLPEPLGVGWDFYLLIYGLMILAFMAGCIWAFAARGADPMGYGLSTLPALFGAFVIALGIPTGPLPEAHALVALALSFAVLLLLDRRVSQLGQTPPWWMRLRILLTALVVLSLAIGAIL